MPPSSTLICMAIFFLESLVAMLQNGFIVTVLSREWMRCRTLPAGDTIVACLAASRFCLHAITLQNNLLTSFGLGSQIYFRVSWDFLNTLTFWMTAWLAVFYCVKIASFSHPVFFWLKWRVSRSVTRLLLSSLILSGLSGISTAMENSILVQKAAAQSFHGNDTRADRLQTVSLYFSLSRFILRWFVPFLLFLVSTLSLMVSLRRHVGQMRDHRLGPRDPSTRAHTVALKSLAFFLIFYTAYFLSLIIVSNTPTLRNHWHWAWEAVIYAGICLHSSVLVQSSPKLRKTLKKRLWRTRHKK